jgi:hypothetical protein
MLFCCEVETKWKFWYSSLSLIYLEGEWGLSKRVGGQQVESSSVAESTPSKHINNGESSWIVSLQYKRGLLCETVTCSKVGNTILLWHAGLGQGRAVERQEDKASERQGTDSASCRWYRGEEIDG